MRYVNYDKGYAVRTKDGWWWLYCYRTYEYVLTSIILISRDKNDVRRHLKRFKWRRA